MFAAYPLLALVVLIYNLIALTMTGGVHAPDPQAQLSQELLGLRKATGVRGSVGLSDVLLATGLVLVFIELLKSTTSRRVAIINHSLSMILFIVCLVEFLLFGAFATSTFFLITLMVLLDVLAGFIVTIASSKRELDLTHD